MGSKLQLNQSQGNIWGSSRAAGRQIHGITAPKQTTAGKCAACIEVNVCGRVSPVRRLISPAGIHCSCTSRRHARFSALAVWAEFRSESVLYLEILKKKPQHQVVTCLIGSRFRSPSGACQRTTEALRTHTLIPPPPSSSSVYLRTCS